MRPALRYPASMTPHDRAIERSLALHAVVAERIAASVEVVERASARVRAWEEDGTVAAHYRDAWARLLAGSREELQKALVDPSSAMHDLRQVSPFAGVSAHWSILRARRERP